MTLPLGKSVDLDFLRISNEPKGKIFTRSRRCYLVFSEIKLNSHNFLELIADANNLSLAILEELATKLLSNRFPSLNQWLKWVPWDLTFQLAVIRLWKMVYRIPFDNSGSKDQILERISVTLNIAIFHFVTAIIFEFLEELRIAGFELLDPAVRDRLDQRDDPGFYHSLKSATCSFFKIEKVKIFRKVSLFS